MTTKSFASIFYTHVSNSFIYSFNFFSPIFVFPSYLSGRLVSLIQELTRIINLSDHITLDEEEKVSVRGHFKDLIESLSCLCEVSTTVPYVEYQFIFIFIFIIILFRFILFYFTLFHFILFLSLIAGAMGCSIPLK